MELTEVNGRLNSGRRAACTLLAGAALGVCAHAASNAYPRRPVRLVVPFAAGGGNDILARVAAAYLTPLLGQPVIVENRMGAGGNVGTDQVAKSPADGYTLVLVTNTVVVNRSMYKALPFDVQKDLQPVALLATAPVLLVTRAASGIQSLQDLLTRGKKRGRLSYATPGIGTPHHLAMELLKRRAGVDLVHVPYSGAAPAVVDVLGGQVPLLVSTPSSVADFITTGRLDLLATMEPPRSPVYPNVPAVAEFLPGFEVGIWYGLMLPAGTPIDVVNLLQGAVKRMVNDAGFQKKLAVLGFTSRYEAAESMKVRMAAELARWKDVAARAGIVAGAASMQY